MKYIRTKDGLYNTEQEGSIRDNKYKIWFIGFAIIYDDEIISQADSIEELCDEFVIIDNRSDLVISIETATRFDKNDWTARYLTINSAIWTDKGLIYVAKMNDKGELELI